MQVDRLGAADRGALRERMFHVKHSPAAAACTEAAGRQKAQDAEGAPAVGATRMRFSAPRPSLSVVTRGSSTSAR